MAPLLPLSLFNPLIPAINAILRRYEVKGTESWRRLLEAPHDEKVDWSESRVSDPLSSAHSSVSHMLRFQGLYIERRPNVPLVRLVWSGLLHPVGPLWCGGFLLEKTSASRLKCRAGCGCCFVFFFSFFSRATQVERRNAWAGRRALGPQCASDRDGGFEGFEVWLNVWSEEATEHPRNLSRGFKTFFFFFLNGFKCLEKSSFRGEKKGLFLDWEKSSEKKKKVLTCKTYKGEKRQYSHFTISTHLHMYIIHLQEFYKNDKYFEMIF